MRDQEAFVVAAVNGRRILPMSAYYAGDGEWTSGDNAKVFYTRKALRSGMKEARESGVPEKATDLVAFGVFV